MGTLLGLHPIVPWTMTWAFLNLGFDGSQGILVLDDFPMKDIGSVKVGCKCVYIYIYTCIIESKESKTPSNCPVQSLALQKYYLEKPANWELEVTFPSCKIIRWTIRSMC